MTDKHSSPGNAYAAVSGVHRAINEANALIGICEAMGHPLSNVVKRLRQIVADLTVHAQSKQEPVSEAELIEAIMSCRPLLLAGLSVRDFAAAAACRIRHDFDVRHTASSHSSTERAGGIESKDPLAKPFPSPQRGTVE